MVRTLRITSLISVAAACAGALFVLVFGFKPNSEIQSYLSQDSVFEQLKKKTGAVVQKDDKISPLVLQAAKFKERIDPTPPPPPPRPVPPPPSPVTKPAPVQVATQVVQQKAIPSKFDLIGTASYTDRPEKSLALLNLVSEGYKWVRQGEKIGQSTIHEIKDGSVILYQNGKKEKELFVPKPQSPFKSLLKSDQSASVSRQRPSSATTTLTTEAEAVELAGSTAVKAPGGETINLPGIDSSPSSDISGQRRESTGNVRIRRSLGVAPVPVDPPQAVSAPVLTPEQQKQSLDESISGIKEIMNVPVEGMSEEELQEQANAWKDLLVLLENEKKNLEQNSGSPSGDASDKKETSKDDPGKDEKK